MSKPPCPCRSGLTFLICEVSYYRTLLSNMIDCPRLGRGGAHRDIYLQRPLVHLVFYYMSSINGATLGGGLLLVAPEGGS